MLCPLQAQEYSPCPGLTLCGPAAGQVVVAPAMGWLVAARGWATCLRWLAGACLLSLAAAAAFRQQGDPDTGGEAETEEDTQPSPRPRPRPWLAPLLGPALSQHPQVLTFLLVVAADFCAVLALFVPYGYLGPVAARAGLAPRHTPLLVAALGLGSVLGRLTAALLSLGAGARARALHTIRAAVCLAAPLPLALTTLDTPLLLGLACAVFGFLTGLWIAATSPLLAQLLGPALLSTALGIVSNMKSLNDRFSWQPNLHFIEILH